MIICGWDKVAESLARDLTDSGHDYVTVVPDVDEVRELEESGVSVVYGVPADLEALKRVRIESAHMLIANMSDPDNTNLTLTAKSICPTPVVSVLTDPARAELMKVAGADHLVPLRETLGNYLAVRATTRGAMSHVVDSMGDLLFAEIPSHGTPFVGLRLEDTGIREKTGASVIGIWERGRFSLPRPDSLIEERTVLLLVGTEPALRALERLTGDSAPEDLVIILGHGTVGRASAALLRRMRVRHVIIDRQGVADPAEPDVIHGDASNLAILEKAGIREAGGLIVTTNDDGMNVFLTLAGRHINPHIRISARANLDTNVAELYSAGADFVVSHTSVGATILANLIAGRKNVFLAEGVRIFWREVPAVLNGKTLAGSGLRSLTGATVVAVQRGPDELELDLDPDTVLQSGTSLVLIGTLESEELFARRFGRRRRTVAPLAAV